MQFDDMDNSDKRVLDEKAFLRHHLYGENKSQVSRYRDLVLGEVSNWNLLYYEFVNTVAGYFPGAAGLLLRRWLFRALFRRIGRGVIFGRAVIYRHPSKIEFGDRVLIDDNCLIDARGAGVEGIVIGDNVMINRGATLQAKVGTIRIGSGSAIGARTTIIAQGGIEIGEAVRIAGGCTISGGLFETRDGQPLGGSGEDGGDIHRYTKGPICIERDARIGMGCMILDGVRIGEGAQVTPMSLVTRDVPAHSVAGGIPARPLYAKAGATVTR